MISLMPALDGFAIISKWCVVSLLLRLGLVNGLFIGYFQVGGSVQNIIENLDKGPNLFNPVHNISNRASKEEGSFQTS